MSSAADFWTSKSTWLGLSWGVSAVVQASLDNLPWPEAVQRIFEGLALVFVRDAMVKSQVQPSLVMAPDPVEPRPVVETPFREETDDRP